ncbi:MAG TPA: hypothetical protein VKT18_04450, partial [Acidimicrobiales bacterium]|nr:hypothetical protein [Acidimicrobiales bacterium]
GIKVLVEQALVKAFRARFPGLVLRIEPSADPAALTAAIKGGHVDRVQLLLVEPPGARALPDLDHWLEPGEAGRVRVEIASARSGGLQTELLERFVDGDEGALAEITRFAGVGFGSVRVGVTLPDSSRRTFDLSRRVSGRAPDRALEGVQLDSLGEPTDASLRQALAGVLDAAGA